MAVAVETAGSSLSSMTVGAMYPGETVFGKSVSALHDSLIISGNVWSGTLKYVSGWTEFSTTPEYQSGNYLAVQVFLSNADRITATLYKKGGANETVELDSSKQVVFRISDPKTEQIKIVGFKNGDMQSYTADLSGLTLQTS